MLQIILEHRLLHIHNIINLQVDEKKKNDLKLTILIYVKL